MTGPDAAQFERAKALLASEGAAAGDAARVAAAAGRVYEKLDAQLSPLIGRAGVQSLFARSAKLSQTALAVSGALEDAARLAAHLQSLAPALAGEAAAELLGTFLDLVTTFIGERLTVQVLRRAWPGIEETATKGPQK